MTRRQKTTKKVVHDGILHANPKKLVKSIKGRRLGRFMHLDRNRRTLNADGTYKDGEEPKKKK
jgi:hypothetical protein